ncbi:MFS transporter [Aeromicrobium sp. 50.2.37]|uniref:MFS transporter n=1 Tax=Aeromicrobium sp. 50.2.37 TaxID=2969305 RepID=UPI00214FA97E|nr:MFS transporter [Aeromicrobium sp. 50.2.37]MCR4514917.1 MFS transporter [Aeromicrobium sp. 50.2.37]
MTTPRRRQLVTFTVLTIAVASFTLLQSLIIPVLPLIQDHFDTTQSTSTWVLTAYLLSASVCTPLLGRIGDAYGKKRMMVIVLVALAIGSLMAALAPSIGWLLVARVVQGLGGGVLPLSFGIIRDEFDDQRRGRALSIIASLAAVGFGVGIVLGGPIVEVLGYAWLFWLPMIATALAALGAAFLVPESPVLTPGGIPATPAVLLAAWLVCLLLPVSQGNVWGWTSWPVLLLPVLAVVLLVAWVVVELRADVPLIDMAMMRRRGVWTANLVAAGVGFGMFAAFGFLPQLLQTPTEAGYGFGATTTESGRLIAPSALASFLVGFVTAQLVARLGARTVILTGTLLNGLAFASIALFHDQTWQLYAAITVQGIGGGLVFSSLANVVIASVPAHQTGVASGMNANIRTIGGSIGSAVMAAIVTSSTGVGGFPLERGYTVGFLVLAAAMFVAALASLRIPDIRAVDQQTVEGSTALADASPVAVTSR